MTIDFITLFPAMVQAVMAESIIGRAQKNGLINLRAHNLRDYTHDRHKTVDDRPFGGGPGMVMKCEPIVEAIEALQSLANEPRAHVIYLTPQGEPLRQSRVRELSREPRLMLLSGHYEGIDERVREGWIDEEISIGDYVLTNGTLPGLVLADAVVRLIPGALGNEESAHDESFTDSLIEGPQYTRPAEFRGKKVPDILMGGNHAEISRWRHQQAETRTRKNRSDLLNKGTET